MGVNKDEKDSWFRHWLKWFVAPKEMEELHRWRIEWNEHRRWLSEFPEVGETLDRMWLEVTGKPDMCSKRSERELIYDFRERLREMKESAKKQ